MRKGITSCVLGSILSVCDVQGALVQLPIVINPFSGSQSFVIVDNVGGRISVGGQQVCTRDVPSSYYYTSSILTGGSGVEFLLSDANSPVRLSAGETLSGSMFSGSWGANALNRFETVLTSFSSAGGGVVHHAEEYFVGFRVRMSDEQYRYGWLEVARNPNRGGSDYSSFRSIAYDDGGSDSVMIQSIPEPSSIVFLAGALGLLVRRR